MADEKKTGYTLTRKIHGGKVTLQPGETVQLTDTEARSDFWRNRINGAPTPAAAEDGAPKLTKAQIIDQLKAKGVKFNGSASVEELAELLAAA